MYTQRSYQEISVCGHIMSNGATIDKATAVPIDDDICAGVPHDLGSSASGTTMARVPDYLGSSAPSTTTVRVTDDLSSPVPRTATTPGRADLPVSLHGHGDAPWLHWLPRQPGQSQQSATRRLHMRLHANTCAVGRVCTHTNKKLASYSAYMHSNQASRLRQESNSRQSSR